MRKAGFRVAISSRSRSAEKTHPFHFFKMRAFISKSGSFLLALSLQKTNTDGSLKHARMQQISHVNLECCVRTTYAFRIPLLDHPLASLAVGEPRSDNSNKRSHPPSPPVSKVFCPSPLNFCRAW